MIRKPARRSLSILAVIVLALIGPPHTYPAFARDLPAQTIQAAGVTFNRAQVLDWISDKVFAVGRWDGTISIFRTPNANEFGPVVLQAFAAPSGRGVEMLADIDELTVVASDGPGRLTVWRRPTGAEPFALIQSASYEAKFGTANSAALVTIQGQPYFVTGHENGHVLLWTLAKNGTLQFATSFDLRSANPIPSPYPLHNIRSLVVWRGDRVISGSEDGDIVGLSLPDGRELFRTRFNQTAQRGINNLSLLGDWLLLSNCSVGQVDKNIWLYDLSTGTPLLRDSENLVLDTQRPQVFNFDAVLVPSKDGPIFFSSTEEGLLWEGKIDGNQLVTTAVTKVASEGGAILRFDSKAALVAAAAYQIWLFKAQ